MRSLERLSGHFRKPDLPDFAFLYILTQRADAVLYWYRRANVIAMQVVQIYDVGLLPAL